MDTITEVQRKTGEPAPEPREGLYYTIEVWSGCDRPYRAAAYRDGHWVGVTGGCKSPGRAADAVRKVFAASLADYPATPFIPRCDRHL